MASGCILGTCLYCKELIWEDEEWDFEDTVIYHSSCHIEDSCNPLKNYSIKELLIELLRRKGESK